MEDKEKLRNMLDYRVKMLIERERQVTHEKLSAMSDEDFLKEWLEVVTMFFGSNAINSTIQQVMKARGITKDDIGFGDVIRAVYQTYTYKAIITFEEFLKVDKENQKKTEN